MKILKPHLSLNVANAEASVAFYSRLFGVEPRNQRTGHASFDIPEPSLFLVVDERTRTGANADHFGVLLATEADLEEAAEKLHRLGIETRREKTKIWLADPDGNAWEFFILPPKA